MTGSKSDASKQAKAKARQTLASRQKEKVMARRGKNMRAWRNKKIMSKITRTNNLHDGYYARLKVRDVRTFKDGHLYCCAPLNGGEFVSVPSKSVVYPDLQVYSSKNKDPCDVPHNYSISWDPLGKIAVPNITPDGKWYASAMDDYLWVKRDELKRLRDAEV